MIHGVGIDILEISKIKSVLQNSKKHLLHHVFHPQEIEFCEKSHNSYAHFATKFAAKEAFLKALGSTGLDCDLKLREIKLVAPDGERAGYSIILRGEAKRVIQRLKIKNIFVDCATKGDYAISQVILEK
jgi:holo-[acyl-carrier protein] synthase